MKIAHFCASLQRDKDGVARILEQIIHYSSSKEDIYPLFITALADGRNDVPNIEVAAVKIPKYEGYKLSVTCLHSIERKMLERNFVPDIIHIHSPCTLGLAGIALARRLGIPVIATYHTHFPSYLKHHGVPCLTAPTLMYLRYVYSSCDAVLVPSETMCRELVEHGIVNLHHLPHGIDQTLFHPIFRSRNRRTELFGEGHGVDSEMMILLFVGRLVWEKNLRVLVESVRKVLHERKDVIMVIVGTGPAENELRRMLPEAQFLGFLSGHKLSEIYASSDIFIFPSDTETFGNVTLEALASGLPCIVADAGGSADLICHGSNGFKIAANNVAGFLEAIIKLIDDKDLRHSMAKNALLSTQQASWEEILSKMHSLYCTMAHEKLLSKQ